VLTRTLLINQIDYNPITGYLTHKNPYRNFTRPSKGYLFKRILGKKYMVHQLAFLYMKGYIPKLIDHIDGNIQNNSWSNLREANKSVNALNTLKSKGVYKSGNKWISKCMIDSKLYYLGTFDSFDIAKKNYNSFKERHICLSKTV
jgi:hypothetical protein